MNSGPDDHVSLMRLGESWIPRYAELDDTYYEMAVSFSGKVWSFSVAKTTT